MTRNAFIYQRFQQRAYENGKEYVQVNTGTKRKKSDGKKKAKRSKMMKKLRFDKLRDQKPISTLMSLLHDYLLGHINTHQP